MAGPHVASDSLFITVIAPFVPITRQVVGRAVVRAIRRTGINAPTQGAHLLRHSAATSLLRTGVSLPTIGALLRHASIETTTIYYRPKVAMCSLGSGSLIAKEFGRRNSA
ncbi:tyrosine-type recombinase/integrase [Paraburkholderia panacisoli]|uniref:tyrosine-type recombinase/integrase n=1 Tax=Paraburkholderia panacisoli TaxID=2603818 RepID=UPI003CCC5AA5